MGGLQLERWRSFLYMNTVACEPAKVGNTLVEPYYEDTALMIGSLTNEGVPKEMAKW